MIKQSKGRIFLSANRSVQQNDSARTYAVFSHAQPLFGDMDLFNDETLAGKCCIKIHIERDCCHTLVPIVGSVRITVAEGTTKLVHPGELLTLQLHSGNTIIFENPYDEELINFLFIAAEVKGRPSGNQIQISRFNLDAHPNHLIMFPGFAIGKFSARSDTSYTITEPSKGIFVFIVEGIFEVQGRLLHPRDGLALWHTDQKIEIEALSNDAILLLVEVDV
jgi:hypothetical protein